MTKASSPIWHPFTQHAINPHSMHVDRAAGAYLFARHEVDGITVGEKRILDAISSWWVITHGHCHPKIQQAVMQQAQALDQVIFAGFTHEPAEKLAKGLMDLTNNVYDHVFYSDSGSTAVEVALKMAIGYWQHIDSPRHKIIAFDGGYHGDTFGTMSAGGRSVYNKIYEPYLFEVEHIPVPVEGNEGVALDALAKVLEDNKGNVAAFVFEPLVLGAGGMVMYSPDTLRAMEDVCRSHGVLLIADEVMTGFGRTGSVFACDQAELVPDIMCLSKGLTGGFLPMGATLCSAEVYQAFYHKDKAKMFFHSSSFTGNPLACAAANASLAIWKEEPVLDRIRDIAAGHAQAVRDLSAIKGVKNIRQKGTILALDIDVESEGYLSAIQPKLYDAFLDRGILLRPLGNCIYILPPYCVGADDLKLVYDEIGNVIELLSA